ncbi:hypothetical protein [Massilia aerilata]|uniref:Uncharacterized protein n=1 Tax=Massilia aerilata TaxID=453817 RepID=A0ABW0RZL5_9BURK
MRELTPNEIDMVSAGPSAAAPLALASPCNGVAGLPAPAIPSLYPAIGGLLLLNPPIESAK